MSFREQADHWYKEYEKCEQDRRDCQDHVDYLAQQLEIYVKAVQELEREKKAKAAPKSRAVAPRAKAVPRAKAASRNREDEGEPI
jgi:hypothetical protein